MKSTAIIVHDPIQQVDATPLSTMCLQHVCGQLTGVDLGSTLHIWRMHAVLSEALEAVGWPKFYGFAMTGCWCLTSGLQGNTHDSL